MQISMCANTSCPSRKECLRFTWISGKLQEYKLFTPKEWQDKCDNFLSNENNV